MSSTNKNTFFYQNPTENTIFLITYWEKLRWIEYDAVYPKSLKSKKYNMGQLYKWLLCTYRPNLTTCEVLYTSKMCDLNVRYQVIRRPGINQLTPWTYCVDIDVRIMNEGGEKIVLCARCSFRGVAGYHSPGWKWRRPSSTPDGNLGFPEIPATVDSIWVHSVTSLPGRKIWLLTNLYREREVRDDSRSSSASKFRL